MKYYCIYQDAKKDVKSAIYSKVESYYKETFSPECRTLDIIPFSISGKTYADRKADAMDKVFRMQQGASAAQDLSYSDLVQIFDFNEKIARRFGLVSEFRENGLI